MRKPSLSGCFAMRRECTATYYDAFIRTRGGLADSTQFYDYPKVDGQLRKSDFRAWLYLVTGPDVNQEGDITFYNGIEWGWSNELIETPEPSSICLLLVAFVSAAIVGRRQKMLRQPGGIDAVS